MSRGLSIQSGSAGHVRELLAAPFGFKGHAVDALWHSAVLLDGGNGRFGCGCGVQSVVWSDPAVFDLPGTDGGNTLMFALTAYALELLKGRSFSSPVEAISFLYDPLLAHAKRLTGLPGLRPTFVLNALVPVDAALWQLFVRQNALPGFDAMLPPEAADALSCRHQKMAGFPLIPYGLGDDAVCKLADEGAFFLKIKIGADPEKDGDREKMLDWDKRRMTRLHALLGDRSTPYTDSGKPLYYLDANGRYDTKDRLLRLLDHLDAIGALERVALLEEPFAEESGIDVGDLPVRVAADESAHGAAEAAALMDLGYTALALKPIAKTLSVSLEVAALAHKRGVPCFCADLTVPPVMVECNKSFAARLQRLPGVKIGVFETNGAQNYADWPRLFSYLPHPDRAWHTAQDGIFTLGDDFYHDSADLFEDSPYYIQLARVGR